MKRSTFGSVFVALGVVTAAPGHEAGAGEALVAGPGEYPVMAQVEAAMGWLREHSTDATRDGMARYAIPSEHALGVAMRDIKALGKQLGHDQELAALWKTGVYEARMLAPFVGDPGRISAAQMDEWYGELDNGAFCDAKCFNLFDRTPYAWEKVTRPP